MDAPCLRNSILFQYWNIGFQTYQNIDVSKIKIQRENSRRRSTTQAFFFKHCNPICASWSNKDKKYRCRITTWAFCFKYCNPFNQLSIFFLLDFFLIFFLLQKYSNTATYSTCNFFKAAATFIQLFSSMRFANTYLSFLLFSLYESCSILFLLAWKNSSFNCKFTFIRFSQ